MKKVLIITILAMASAPSFAQIGKSKENKIATFGFDVGVNRSNLAFASTQTDGDLITNGLGYRLGVVSNFRVSQRFSFAPKAELSFNSSALSSLSDDLVSPANLELLGHLKFKLRKGNLSPYIIAGPNLRLPLGGNSDLIPTKENVAIDIGIGLDVPIFKWKVAPELRYSYGLMNINRNQNVSDLKFHNIALVLILSGK